MPNRNLPVTVSMCYLRSDTEITYQAEIRKEKVQELINSFNLKQDLSCHSMIRLPNLFTIDNGIDSREESTV